MGSRTKNQIKKVRNTGMSCVDILRMKQIAKNEVKSMETEATDKAFLYMLAIPLKVLCSEYWSKTAKRKAPQFIEKVFDLYEAVQSGVVTDKQLADQLEELAGVKIDADWLKDKERRK